LYFLRFVLYKLKYKVISLFSGIEEPVHIFCINCALLRSLIAFVLLFDRFQYVKSHNCLMEFRFAAIQLRLPVIIAVVGTGNAWETTEVEFLYYLLYFT